VYNRILAVIAVIAIVACGSDSSTAPNIETAAFAPALNIDLSTMTKTASGLYYKDSIIGTGTTASSRDSVRVHYIGWLANGQQFDNSFQRGQPIAFSLGRGRVIAGWDEGLVNMKAGGWRKLVIPPSLGYGDEAQGSVIPANSILVFNVQLVSVVK
jgi:FKBP-type peptidyl-prolyl cis-trans isomerase